MVHGKKYGNGKKYHFSFSLFLLKLISKKLSWKEGKVNTMQHGQGEKQTQGGNIDKEGKNIFPQYTTCESRTIIAWPRREKMKTQGEKKDTGAKIKTEGGKISYIFTQLKYSAQIRIGLHPDPLDPDPDP